MERVLIDTNLIIYREDNEVLDKKISQLIAILSDSDEFRIVVHPLSYEELKKNRNTKEREIILSKVEAYSVIDSPPKADVDFHNEAGYGTNNDIIDNELLFAVYRGCVSYFITNDIKLRRKAARVGIKDRVFGIEDAIEHFIPSEKDSLYVPVSIKQVPLHNIDLQQDFFDSLRDGYNGFDEWFKSKARQGRVAYCSYRANNQLGSFLLMKAEDANEEYKDFDKPLEPRPRLKLSTLKVADRGKHMGESLIQIMFDEAYRLKLTEIYTTIYKEQEELIDLLSEYGFKHITDKNTKNGRGQIGKEMVLLKKITPNAFPEINWNNNTFVVPIEPKYHRKLFPDAETNYQLELQDLSGGNPFSNAIKKAYFTRSNTNRIHMGDVLCFYASHDKRCITAIGTADAIFSNIRSAEEAFEIAKKRTVYDLDDIKEQFSSRTKLILFKKNCVLSEPISYEKMRALGILKGAPQSITKVSSAAMKDLVEKG